jgi:AraC-like DNA-binding protein
MTVRLSAADEPASSRVDYWQHVLGGSLAPYQISVVGSDFRSQIHQAQIGPVTVVDIRTSAAEAVRTPALVRDSDLGMCKVDIGIRGRARYEQDGRQSTLAPAGFHLIDFSRPSHVAINAPHEVAAVMFPRELLPARERDLRDLTAVPFSAQDPHAALVASLGRELVWHLDFYEGDRGARVGAAFLNLLVLAVATRLDRVPAVSPETREQAMAARVRAFIGEHLGDPGLSPAMIAAAHHISVRALHRLYEAEGLTVAGWIRQRRLECCRRDLLDAGLHRRPVGAIGARWGFRDATAFSRAFRAAYGLPPGEYRAIHAVGYPAWP